MESSKQDSIDQKFTQIIEQYLNERNSNTNTEGAINNSASDKESHDLIKQFVKDQLLEEIQKPPTMHPQPEP